MVKFEFYLSDTDVDRLFAIKKKQGKDDMTGNAFARELLECTLYQLCPRKPQFDESGNVIER